MNRDFKGIWIPKEIWLTDGLSTMEKVLWSEIDSLFSDEKGGCHASNDYLCNFFGIKIRRLQEILASLKEKKFLIELGFDGRQRLLKAVIPHNEDCSQVDDLPPERGEPHSRGAEKCTPPMKDSAPPIYKEENRAYRKDKKSRPSASTAAQEAASLLFKKLNERNPKMMLRNVNQWPNQIDDMMRLDKRTLEETKSVIELTFSQDYFWGKTIKSPTSLRKHFDRVMDDIIHPPKAKREENKREKELEDQQTNQIWITPLKNVSFDDMEKRILISSESIGIYNGKDYQAVPYSAPGFKPMVLHRLRNWGMIDLMEQMQSTI